MKHCLFSPHHVCVCARSLFALLVFMLCQLVCWLAIINYDHLHILPIYHKGIVGKKIKITSRTYISDIYHENYWHNLYRIEREIPKLFFSRGSIYFQVNFKYSLFLSPLILSFTRWIKKLNQQILITIQIIVCTQIFSGNFFLHSFGVFVNYSLHVSLLINNLWAQFEMRQQQQFNVSQKQQFSFSFPNLII